MWKVSGLEKPNSQTSSGLSSGPGLPWYNTCARGYEVSVGTGEALESAGLGRCRPLSMQLISCRVFGNSFKAWGLSILYVDGRGNDMLRGLF